MLKLVGLAKRKEGMALADFHRHWVGAHADIAKKLPGLRKYKISPFVSGFNGEEPVWDGMSELWFDDLASLKMARESDVWAASGRDRPNFQGEVQSLLLLCSDEHDIPV